MTAILAGGRWPPIPRSLLVRSLSLTWNQAREVLGEVGVTGPITIAPVHEHNHVWRLSSDAGTFFLKIYTKSWYAAHGAAHAFPVTHEAGAWRCLKAHGLATPEVVVERIDVTNPLGRPFLLTRALAGHPLVSLLRQSNDIGPLLRAVGDYLRQMHAVSFAFPGYVSNVNGPTAPLRPGAYRHRCFTPEARQKTALDMVAADSARLSADVRGNLDSAIATMPERLRSACEPPRFVHGDCHANSFFLVDADESWQVTGTVDMEVASAGDVGEDLMKMCIELASVLPASARWWGALFDAYGAVPDFDLLKLRLLGAAPREFFALTGRSSAWWGEFLRLIMHADSWQELFRLWDGHGPDPSRHAAPGSLPV